MKTILHIGLPKTGTTLVQNYMASHRDLLREHGLNYPDMSKMGAPIGATGHHYFAHQLAASDANIPRFRDFLKAERVTGGNDLFLSAEPLARHALLAKKGVYDTWADKGRYVSRVRAAVGDGDIEVLIVLRQPHLLAESAYKELIKKTRASESFAQFIATRFYGYDFKHLLALWQGSFKKLNVRLFEHDLKNPEGLAGAILRPYCPNLPDIATMPIENASLHPTHVEFKRLLNSGPFSDKDLADIITALAGLSARNEHHNPPSLWSKETLSAFQPRIDMANHDIAQKYFNQTKPLYKPINYAEIKWFTGMSPQIFANTLDEISEILAPNLTDRIIQYLADHLQTVRR